MRIVDTDGIHEWDAKGSWGSGVKKGRELGSCSNYGCTQELGMYNVHIKAQSWQEKTGNQTPTKLF